VLFRDKKGKIAPFENMEFLQKTGLKAENSIKRKCRNGRKMPKQWSSAEKSYKPVKKFKM